VKHTFLKITKIAIIHRPKSHPLKQFLLIFIEKKIIINFTYIVPVQKIQFLGNTGRIFEDKLQQGKNGNVIN